MRIELNQHELPELTEDHDAVRIRAHALAVSVSEQPTKSRSRACNMSNTARDCCRDEIGYLVLSYGKWSRHKSKVLGT